MANSPFEVNSTVRELLALGSVVMGTHKQGLSMVPILSVNGGAATKYRGLSSS